MGLLLSKFQTLWALAILLYCMNHWTTAHRPNLTWCLFCMNHTKNIFYTFQCLKKIERIIYFMIRENDLKSQFLCLWIEFHWNIAMPISLYIIYGYFYTIMASWVVTKEIFALQSWTYLLSHPLRKGLLILSVYQKRVVYIASVISN